MLPKAHLTSHCRMSVTGHKKGQNNAICSNMEGPRSPYMREVRQRQISYDIAYVWNQKKGTGELIYKTEVEHVENKLLVTWR